MRVGVVGAGLLTDEISARVSIGNWSLLGFVRAIPPGIMHEIGDCGIFPMVVVVGSLDEATASSSEVSVFWSLQLTSSGFTSST